jgi:hypothetical protein
MPRKLVTMAEAMATGLAEIHCEDFPYIDPETEDGKEEFGAIAFWVHRRYPAIVHVVFKRGGEKIGEMLFPPEREKMS